MFKTSAYSDATTAASRRFATENLASIFGFLFFWGFWSWRYRDFLFALGDSSLFLWRSDFLRLWLADPAGALGYLAAFIIQFCQVPILGGAILALLALALQRIVARLLRVQGTALVWSFIPSATLAIAATWNGYYVYDSHYVSTVISGYIGGILATCSFFVVRKVPFDVVRGVVALVLGLVGYRYFGVWGSFFLTICALGELERGLGIERGENETAEKARNKRRYVAFVWGRFALLLTVAFLTPTLVFWASLYAKTHFSFLWLLGLTQDVLQSQDEFVARAVVFGAAVTPVYIALAYLVAILYRQRRKLSTRRDAREKKRRETKAAKLVKKSGKEKTPKRQSSKEEASASAVVEESTLDAARKPANRLLWELLFGGAVLTVALSFHTEPFFTILAQNRALTNEDWNRILELDADLERPIDHNVALRNVALLQLDQLVERAFERPIAGFNTLPVGPEDFERSLNGDALAKIRVASFKRRRLTQSAALNTRSEEIFCRYGLTNVAARCAMNKFAGAANRSVSCLRTLALCAMVNGEKALAKRYLLELRQSLFQRQWADERLAWLETPDFYKDVRDALDDPNYPTDLEVEKLTDDGRAETTTVSRERLDAISNSVLRMRAMRPLIDEKELDVFPDLARLYGVFSDDFESATRLIQEVELIAALFQKGDFKSAGDNFFMNNVEKYLGKYCPEGGAPKGIEEGYALLRFEKFGDDWDKGLYQFSAETKEKFGEYVDFYRRRSGALSSDDSQNAIRACCQGTYWGYAKDESAFIYF